MTQRTDEVFICALTCMDGRVVKPLLEWVDENIAYTLPGKIIHVDLVTEPGIDGGLSAGSDELFATIAAKAAISRDKHGAELLIIVGHEDCAGHPVVKERHYADIKSSCESIFSWGFSRVIGLYIDGVKNRVYEVEQVYDLSLK